MDKFKLNYLFENKYSINDLNRILKNKSYWIKGNAGLCIIYSEDQVKERVEYHNRNKTVDPNYVFFSILSFKNSPKSGKLLPEEVFDEDNGLAEGASLYYFLNVKTGKIAEFYMDAIQGSGYTRGFKWKPKDVSYVGVRDFVKFMSGVCKRGVKKKFWS